MSAGNEIWNHVMQKKIDNAQYWREIVILEEGPYVFKVVQEHRPGGELRSSVAGMLQRTVWTCPSREAATEQALRCLQESRKDAWSFPASESSVA
jgi:hypothetical protein